MLQRRVKVATTTGFSPVNRFPRPKSLSHVVIDSRWVLNTVTLALSE